VLGASAIVAAFMLVLTTQVVPRTNERLQVVQLGVAKKGDRTMTVSELSTAATRAASPR
jgi:hypothetical protein